MGDVIKKVENEKVALTVSYDDGIGSPREENENFGTFYTWQRNYYSPDKQRFNSAREWMETLAADYTTADTYEKTNDQLRKIIERHYIVMPVFKYEHSGVAYNTSGFSCPWDSGQVGFIFVSKADVRKEWGRKRVTPSLRKKAEEILKVEVEEYSKWANGECYHYELEAKTPLDGVEFDPDDESTYELTHVDSCGGFLGWEHLESGIVDSVPEQYQDIVSEL